MTHRWRFHYHWDYCIIDIDLHLTWFNGNDTKLMVSILTCLLNIDIKCCDTGGCNGCLNVNNPDNKGLETLVRDLETVYQENNFTNIISRADMWALMGIWSVQESIERNNEDCIRWELCISPPWIYWTCSNKNLHLI